MPSLFPTQSALQGSFGNQSPFAQRASSSANPTTTSKLARPELYTAWSVADDAKLKTAQLSDAAAKELQKASDSARAKTGKIELYSAKYYAACTLGGLMACVSRSWPCVRVQKLTSSGSDPLGCHAS